VTIAVMAFVGLYSSLLHFIATRRRELSIRMACGASPRALFRMVEVRALRIGLWALAIALVCLPVLRWAIQSGLAGAIGWSWMIVALATLGCVTSILLVAVFPATQASRIMPAEVLRDIT
jgi:ABC-type antimicrobial peptide transport system permease subunit